MKLPKLFHRCRLCGRRILKIFRLCGPFGKLRAGCCQADYELSNWRG